MEPTDWFRIRHADPFPPEAVAAFRASCSIYRAKMEAVVRLWRDLPSLATTPAPVVTYFEPEVSADGRVLSLPIRLENKVLGSRALFQSTASRELVSWLPIMQLVGVEVGLTESAFEGEGWRHDWWDPHNESSMKPEEAFRALGITIRGAGHP